MEPQSGKLAPGGSRHFKALTVCLEHQLKHPLQSGHLSILNKKELLTEGKAGAMKNNGEENSSQRVEL